MGAIFSWTEEGAPVFSWWDGGHVETGPAPSLYREIMRGDRMYSVVNGRKKRSGRRFPLAVPVRPSLFVLAAAAGCAALHERRGRGLKGWEGVGLGG